MLWTGCPLGLGTHRRQTGAGERWLWVWESLQAGTGEQDGLGQV